MKRLWVRAHALPEVDELWRRMPDSTTKSGIVLPFSADEIGPLTDPNAMVIVRIPDDLAAAVQRDNFLRASGKVLAEGEEPPYVGSDPPLSEEELRTEFAR